MAKRRDLTPTRRRPLTVEERIDLTCGIPSWDPRLLGLEPRLRALWQAHRDELMAAMPHLVMPWAYWEFEGPPELRDPEDLDYLPAEGDVVGWAAKLRQEHELEQARTAYLLTRGLS